MAKVKFSRGWRGFKNHVENAPERVQKRAAQIVEETVKDGANLTQRNIVRAGRVDTTLMYRSVSYTTPRTSYHYGRFGWGLNGHPYEDYFWYQEQGFRHVSGTQVAGMHALYGALVEVREDFYRKVKEMAK